MKILEITMGLHPNILFGKKLIEYNINYVALHLFTVLFGMPLFGIFPDKTGEQSLWD